jgi:hypothetical protein
MQSLIYRIFFAMMCLSINVCELEGIAMFCGSFTFAGVERFVVNDKLISRVAIE